MDFVHFALNCDPRPPDSARRSIRRIFKSLTRPSLPSFMSPAAIHGQTVSRRQVAYIFLTIKDRLSSRFRKKNAMHSLLPACCLLFLRLHTLLSDLPDPSTPRPQVNEDGSANWIVAGFIMIYTVTVVFTVLEVDFSWACAATCAYAWNGRRGNADR